MRHLAIALTGIALLAAPAAAKPRLSPEAEIARALKDRVPGPPVDCVDLTRIRSTQIVDRTALLYDAGNVIYLNRPTGGAEQLDNWDTLVTQTFSNRLCRPDIVRLLDKSSRFFTGSVLLGDFIPYRRVRRPR